MSGNEALVTILVAFLAFAGTTVTAVFAWLSHKQNKNTSRMIEERVGTVNGKGDLLSQMGRLWDINDKVDEHRESTLQAISQVDQRVTDLGEHFTKLDERLDIHIQDDAAGLGAVNENLGQIAQELRAHIVWEEAKYADQPKPKRAKA